MAPLEGEAWRELGARSVDVASGFASADLDSASGAASGRWLRGARAAGDWGS